MKTPFFRTAYNYDTDQASIEAGLKCEDLSLAQQHQKDEADINSIVKRFGLTGELPNNTRMPQYGDYTGITDYKDALDAVRIADKAFMALPAHIRSYFNNDPENLLVFIADENNRDEAEKLGLVPPKERSVEVLPKVTLVPVASPITT